MGFDPGNNFVQHNKTLRIDPVIINIDFLLLCFLRAIAMPMFTQNQGENYFFTKKKKTFYKVTVYVSIDVPYVKQQAEKKRKGCLLYT